MTINELHLSSANMGEFTAIIVLVTYNVLHASRMYQEETPTNYGKKWAILYMILYK